MTVPRRARGKAGPLSTHWDRQVFYPTGQGRLTPLTRSGKFLPIPGERANLPGWHEIGCGDFVQLDCTLFLLRCTTRSFFIAPT